MTVLRAPGPPNEACRIVICTSAEVPFVKTLVKSSSIHHEVSDGVAAKTEAEVYWNVPRILLCDGAGSAVQRRVQLGYRRWNIARMMKELDLKRQKVKDGE